MKPESASAHRHLVIGLAAGIAGTAAMMAMRMFDQKYAPRTVTPSTAEPGRFVLHAVKGSADPLSSASRHMDEAAAMAMHFVYGAAFGALFGLVRPGNRRRFTLADGAVLGSVVYAVGYLGWLPIAGLNKPVWKQKFPEIAGELLRHVAYGVATATTYDAIESTT